MTRAKGGLGRGLEALIPSVSGAIDTVDVDLIVSNPHQPRARFDSEALEELAASVREHGLLQPLVVTRLEDGGPNVYQLIAGERRLQAARLAGLHRVPVVIREASSQQSLEMALVENLQRTDLNALEEAQAFRRLADDFGMTQEEIAARVGKSRTAVANAMRLLALDDDVKASLARDEISEGHARALLAVAKPDERRALWRRIIDEGLSVRDAEAQGRARKAPAARRGRRVDADTAALEERLRAALGTRVSLHRGRRGGRLTVHFYSDEELEAVLRRLGVKTEGP